MSTGLSHDEYNRRAAEMHLVGDKGAMSAAELKAYCEANPLPEPHGRPADAARVADALSRLFGMKKSRE